MALKVDELGCEGLDQVAVCVEELVAGESNEDLEDPRRARCRAGSVLRVERYCLTSRLVMTRRISSSMSASMSSAMKWHAMRPSMREGSWRNIGARRNEMVALRRWRRSA